MKNRSKNKKVALGMSGGVDSSLCAHLLVKQGYDVTGVFMECWRAPGCRTDQDRKDALAVALSLSIPFKVLDFKDAYKESVVENFFEEYRQGRTPNPDVLCNKEIKFGLFYDWAMENGFNFVATGHYAKIVNSQLCIPADTHKDQTYFLYVLNAMQLEHIIFPLADFTKDQVREQAKARLIHVADKKDSVGICFIGDINVHSFLKERLGENPGEVVDTSGNVIGAHSGLWFYTVGQRHGFIIEAKSTIIAEGGKTVDKHNIPPFYVIEKRPETNQLVVGFGSETLKNSFEIKDLHWIGLKPSPRDLQSLTVRIRHTGERTSCNLIHDTIILSTSIKGVSEGQSAVLYSQSDGETKCLGGGIISAPLANKNSLL
ncbi:MAG: tRNA 2-thiouridine(34) synthase MnmA [Microgenomates group bacterium]